MKNKKFKISNQKSKFWILNFIFIFLILNFTFEVFAISNEPPNRIISLAPNLTEILFAMGLGDKIVGVTNFCDYPEDSKKKPKVGGMYNPSLEAVISLRPDIVVMTTDGNLKEFEERIRSLSIKTYVFKARRLSELPQGIRDMGSALGMKDKAEALAKEIDTAFNRFKGKNQKSNFASPSFNFPLTKGGYRGAKGGHGEINKKKVLFIIWPEPLIVAGSGTAIDDAISLLGCENIASKANISYPRYSIEEIVCQAPDVIFIGKGHADVKAVSSNIIRKLSEVPAVKHGEVFYIGDSMYRLSPGIIQGIGEMARCLK